ncbi:MAG: hypothetical protein Q9227_004963 [Pyrenula ochraceoflavens]
MASFLTDLWNSIFTPGPTPTLLVATNTTFAALQTLLFILLVATHSVHFIVLSILSAGLWWSINWFASELAAAKRAEQEEEKQRREAEGVGKEGDSETETETETKSPDKRKPAGSKSRKEEALKATATGGLLKPDDTLGESLTKRKSLGESGYISTDSEWEKVDESDEKER